MYNFGAFPRPTSTFLTNWDSTSCTDAQALESAQEYQKDLLVPCSPIPPESMHASCLIQTRLDPQVSAIGVLT